MKQEDFEHNAPRWREQAYKTSLACGANSIEADDIAQDVLLKLWMIRDQTSRYASTDALVTVMARNLTIDMHRRQKPIALSNNQAIEPIAEDDPAQLIIDAEQEQRLMLLVNRLPSRQQAVLMLRQVERRTYAEIAALLGIGESSAKTLLSRARKTLLEQFTNEI